tara:strand:+ start:1306 stop:1482 length:177 start_codon:yes stop_codon:yes gene_type:complete
MAKKNTKSSNINHQDKLQHIEFTQDGVVKFALWRKATQRKLWESMQQFADIYSTKISK